MDVQDASNIKQTIVMARRRAGALMGCAGFREPFEGCGWLCPMVYLYTTSIIKTCFGPKKVGFFPNWCSVTRTVDVNQIADNRQMTNKTGGKGIE